MGASRRRRSPAAHGLLRVARGDRDGAEAAARALICGGHSPSSFRGAAGTRNGDGRGDGTAGPEGKLHMPWRECAGRTPRSGDPERALARRGGGCPIAAAPAGAANADGGVQRCGGARRGGALVAQPAKEDKPAALPWRPPAPGPAITLRSRQSPERSRRGAAAPNWRRPSRAAQTTRRRWPTGRGPGGNLGWPGGGAARSVAAPWPGGIGVELAPTGACSSHRSALQPGRELWRTSAVAEGARTQLTSRLMDAYREARRRRDMMFMTRRSRAKGRCSVTALQIRERYGWFPRGWPT